VKPSGLRVGLLSMLVGAFAFHAGQARAQGARPPSGRSQPPPSCGDARQMATDRALGQAMAQDLMAHSMRWTGEQVNEYVRRLGRELARNSGAQREITFLVVYSHELNAQTFPGGFVFINSAIIGAAESEGDLASVLAHEIAHVNNCDWRRRKTGRNAAILLPVAPLVESAAPVGMAAGLGGTVSTRLAQARLSRAKEQEADRLAIEYLSHAGYDPRSALRMFERVEAQGAGHRGLLATHSDLSARRRRLEVFLANLPATPPRVHDSAEFQEVRKEILRYNEVYARALGVPLPGVPPKLMRRPTVQP
jgi:predicted Zn-dependent protease